MLAMPKTTPTPSEAAPSESHPATKRKERSTNYPAHTIHEALSRAEAIWKKEKKVPVSSQIAAEHMGFKNATSGAAAPMMSSLRKYGIIETTAHGEIRISDDASVVYIFPPNAPEHVAALKRLAMRPSIFGEVLKKFPHGLPSQENLRAKLQHEFGFVSAEAADAFMRTLRAAISVGGPVDGVAQGGGAGGGAPKREEATTPPANQIAPPAGAPPPQSPPVRQERHAWKLANGAWAEIIITGTLSTKGLAKLKGYVALLDAEDDDAEEIREVAESDEAKG